MDRRKKRQQQQQTNETTRRSRSPKLSVALDLVNKPNPSSPRVDGIRSLLSRKLQCSVSHAMVFEIFFRRDLFLTFTIVLHVLDI